MGDGPLLRLRLLEGRKDCLGGGSNREGSTGSVEVSRGGNPVCLDGGSGGTADAGGESGSPGRRKGLFVTGSFVTSPRYALDCRRSRLRASGLSFSISACSCIDCGLGRFSPDTRRGDDGNWTPEGCGGLWVFSALLLKGDWETSLLLRTCLKLFDERRAMSVGNWRAVVASRRGESRLEMRRGEMTPPPPEVLLLWTDGGELQPAPDSRRMLAFTGSGDWEKSLSLRGCALDMPPWR